MTLGKQENKFLEAFLIHIFIVQWTHLVQQFVSVLSRCPLYTD